MLKKYFFAVILISIALLSLSVFSEARGLILSDFQSEIALSSSQKNIIMVNGDANNDGNTNFLDAILILKHIDGQNVNLNYAASDLNKDRKIDFVDALALLNKLQYEEEIVGYSGSFPQGKSSLQWVCEGPFVRGDVNSDGDVNVADVIFWLMFQFVSGSDGPECLDRADVNDDESANIADAIYSLSFLFGNGPVLEEPYPGEGYDELCDDIDNDRDLFTDEGCYSFCEISDTWDNTYGGLGDEDGWSIRRTLDCGYVLAGFTNSIGTGDSDAWLFKIDPNGDIVWEKSYGNIGDEDWAFSVRQTINSNNLLDGYIMGGWSFNGIGDAYILLVRTDEDGNAQWVKKYGGSYGDVGKAVQQIRNVDGEPDGFIVVGSTDSITLGENDVWLIKVDDNGDIEWEKKYGDTISDNGYDVKHTFDGGYVIVGNTKDAFGRTDTYLIKVDSQGNEEWSKTYGGNEFDEGYSVQQTIDGGYAIAGYTSSFGSGGNDFYLIKVDSQGNEEWSNSYGGSNLEISYSMQQTFDGGYAIAGYTSSFGSGGNDFYLIKVDSQGNEEWSKTYGGSGSDVGRSIQQTSEGYIISGFSYSFGLGRTDAYVIKIDSQGNF
jgi:hypothetical protein